MNSEPTDRPPAGKDDPGEMVTLRVFSSSGLAEVAAGCLRANDIQCWITVDDCGGMIPALDLASGVKLLVGKTDAEEAAALLAALPSPVETANDASAPPERPPRAGHSFGQLFAGIAIGAAGCLLVQFTARLGTRTYRRDTNHDGTTDEITVKRNGRTIELARDRNYDGSLDVWYYFDAQGKPVLTKEDRNSDKIPDAFWYYTNGILQRSEFDNNFDGKVDVTYVYQGGQPQQADWRPGGTNAFSARALFHQGILAEESRDLNGDGILDIRILYDASGKPVQTNTLNPAAAVPVDKVR